MTEASAALAALAVAAAVLLLFPARAQVADRSRRPTSQRLLIVALAGALVVAWPLLAQGRVLALGLVAAGVVLGAAQLLRRRRAARSAERAALRATELCEALAAELAAGAAPHLALVAVAQDLPGLEALVGAGRFASDVPAVLRDLADRPGLGDLRLVASAWQVSHRSGSGLADTLERVGATLRARRRTARLVAAELAAAHATARIMAALPVVFVLAGSGLGADPVGFLTGSAGGVACLAVGLLLTWAGLAWLQRIADRVGAG